MREYIHVEDAAKASVVALQDEFKNQSVVLTGHEPIKVIDLLKMLGEILNLSNDGIEFVDGDYVGHYVRTPYAYQPKIGRKFIPQCMSISVRVSCRLLKNCNLVSIYEKILRAFNNSYKNIVRIFNKSAVGRS